MLLLELGMSQIDIFSRNVKDHPEYMHQNVKENQNVKIRTILDTVYTNIGVLSSY